MGFPPAGDQSEILSEAENATYEAQELTKRFFLLNNAAAEKPEKESSSW